MLARVIAASAVLLSLAGAANAQAYYYPAGSYPVYAAQPPVVYAQPTYYAQPVYTQPTYYAQPVYAAPVYAPSYYGGYYSPFSIGLNFGYGGYGHGGYGYGGRR